jgi:hypothetical protein
VVVIAQEVIGARWQNHSHLLVDGTPNGLKTGELIGWNGNTVVCQRSHLASLAKRPEATRTRFLEPELILERVWQGRRVLTTYPCCLDVMSEQEIQGAFMVR